MKKQLLINFESVPRTLTGIKQADSPHSYLIVIASDFIYRHAKI
jgi:hypothetical protein